MNVMVPNNFLHSNPPPLVSTGFNYVLTLLECPRGYLKGAVNLKLCVKEDSCVND